MPSNQPTIKRENNNDAENPDQTSKRRNVLLNCMLVLLTRISGRIKRMLQGNKWPTIDRQAYSHRSQNDVENVAIAWIDYKNAWKRDLRN